MSRTAKTEMLSLLLLKLFLGTTILGAVGDGLASMRNSVTVLTC